MQWPIGSQFSTKVLRQEFAGRHAVRALEIGDGQCLRIGFRGEIGTDSDEKILIEQRRPTAVSRRGTHIVFLVECAGNDRLGHEIDDWSRFVASNS